MRLTHKHKYKNDNKRFVFDMKDYRKACQKLGQLEDILEKYHIENIEELEILCKYAESVREWMSIYKEKMYKIRDIEEELGIDLITLFKALRDGIYFKVKDKIYFTNGLHLNFKEKRYLSLMNMTIMKYMNLMNIAKLGH